MKTPKQKRYITIRWSCGYGHEHKIKELAQACIQKNIKRGWQKTLNIERNKKIALRWAEYKNFSKVGREFGLSGSVIRFIVAKIERVSRQCIASGSDVFWYESWSHGELKKQWSISREYAYKYFYIKMGSKLSNDMIYESIKNEYW